MQFRKRKVWIHKEDRHDREAQRQHEFARKKMMEEKESKEESETLVQQRSNSHSN